MKVGLTRPDQQRLGLDGILRRLPSKFASEPLGEFRKQRKNFFSGLAALEYEYNAGRNQDAIRREVGASYRQFGERAKAFFPKNP
jgi:hypothetical protein